MHNDAPDHLDAAGPVEDGRIEGAPCPCTWPGSKGRPARERLFWIDELAPVTAPTAANGAPTEAALEEMRACSI